MVRWNVPRDGSETLIGTGWLHGAANKFEDDNFIQVYTEEEGEPEVTRRVRTIRTFDVYPDTEEGVWNCIGTVEVGGDTLHVIKFNSGEPTGYIKGRSN